MAERQRPVALPLVAFGALVLGIGGGVLVPRPWTAEQVESPPAQLTPEPAPIGVAGGGVGVAVVTVTEPCSPAPAPDPCVLIAVEWGGAEIHRVCPGRPTWIADGVALRIH